ncbi:MAG: glycosyltransferase [Nanoarchaeota archaeon]|nr:glycosyltransferase [Nanoarchaeota archaeon]MBU0977100.1 glycosyltransferase [Nanoarchaeota archaeon]
MSKEKPLVSIVMPTYNRRKKIGVTLESLKRQIYPLNRIEVIIVDDNSSESSEDIAMGYKGDFRRLIYLKNESNKGPAFSRNRGVRESMGEFIFFTDDDGIASEKWISEFVDFYEKHPKVGGVGGPLIPVSKSFVACIEVFKDRILGLKKNKVMMGRDVSVGFTSNMSYRREIFDKCGYFNTAFKAPAGEDRELGKRVAKHFDLAYVPVEMLHNHDYNAEYLVNLLTKQGLEKNPKGNLAQKIIFLLVRSPILVFNVSKKVLNYRLKR